MKKSIILIGSIAMLMACSRNPQTGQTQFSIPSWVNDATVTAGFAEGTQAGLKLGINDTAKRQAMADLLQYIASQGQTFLTVTGDNSPEALAAFLNANIPSNIKSEFPDLVSFAVPLLVSGYGAVYTKYGNNLGKLSPWMKDACEGITLGSATFATH